MVLSVTAIHWGLKSYTNVISLRFMAFERSIDPIDNSPTNGGQLRAYVNGAKQRYRSDIQYGEIQGSEPQLSTIAIVKKTSCSRFHTKFSLRKWRPPDMDNNREAIGPIPLSMLSSKNPVNRGGIEG